MAAGGARYFGCSVMRADLDAAKKRGARQRAVAVVSAFPAFGLLEEKAAALAALASVWEDPSRSRTLSSVGR